MKVNYIKNTLIICCVLLVTVNTSGQEKVTDTISRTTIINANTNGNKVNFTPEAPTLNQIAGAPKAFYTYFWELGDGNYSTEEAPRHTYKEKGDYNVKLWATNNYDTGKPPTSRPKKVAVTSANSEYNDTSSMLNDFDIIRNREPMPNEEMVVVMRYKNPKDYVANGKVYLFYNEQKYKVNNFNIKDINMYHNEEFVLNDDNSFTYAGDIDDYQSLVASSDDGLVSYNSFSLDSINKTNLPQTLEASKNEYRDWSAFNFNEIQPNEERNVFFTMKTPPEMLKDTSAIISVRGIYIPDNNYDNHQVKDMEMEIVTSHDPNKMSTNSTILNYRLVRFKRLKFKTRFQNNGEGPATTIRLETDIPDMFDKTTLQVEGMYPECKICPKGETVSYSCLDTIFTDKQAIFTFKNIYLPGSEQKGVKEKDSTKGFVKYSIKLKDKFHKKKTKSRTAIIFDKNEPILTNYSTTRFLPGISVGVKAGYNHYLDLQNSKSYFIGATISPYKSYRWYWQVELINSFNSYDDSENLILENIIDSAQGVLLERTTISESFSSINWEIPILARYNLNNFIGIGAGIQANINLSETNERNSLLEYYGGDLQDRLLSEQTKTVIDGKTNSFTNFKAGLLFEITGGFARIGPSLGARYVMNFEEDFNYLQFYAIWKF